MVTITGRPAMRYLSFAEREEIALLRAQHVGVREIGRRLGRALFANDYRARALGNAW